MTQHWL